MKWLNEPREQPAAKQQASPPGRAAKPPAAAAVDTGELRRALTAAASASERTQSALALARALAASLQSPQPEDPPEVWAAAACEILDKAMALAWAAGVKGDAWLGEVATHGRFAEVRLAAAQRIEDSAVLESIAQISRNKDKGVYRHCADLLEHRRQTDERRRRAPEMAAALRGLLDIEPLPLPRLLELESELRALGAEDPSLADCYSLLAQGRDRVQQESIALRDLKVRQAAATALLGECAGVALPEPAQLTLWRARLDTLVREQAGIAPWLESRPASKKLESSRSSVESRLAALAVECERALACEQFLATLDAAMPIDAQAHANAAAAWAALPKPEDPEARQSLESRWATLPLPVQPAAPVQAAPAPSPRRKYDHDQVRRLMEKLEQDAEQGHLADADATLNELTTALEGNALHGAMESRLQRVHLQLGELRRWARWGTEQARENLIAAAEKLLNDAPGVDDLVRDVPALREQWTQLNAHGPAVKDQWKRFDTTLEKAWLPVAARQAAEAARHAAARAAKEARCTEWEAAVAGIVWDQADYKVVEAQRQKMVSQWRSAAHGSFRDERILRKRFDKLIEGIDRRLDAVRAAEMERREQLIAAAEALGPMPDSGRAIREARALQDRWNQQAGPLRINRGIEQKLWGRFRGACDIVFAQRDAERAKLEAQRDAERAKQEAQRAEQDAQQQELTRSRQIMLDEFAVTLAGTDVNAIKRGLIQLRPDRSAAKANSRESGAGLNARARDLLHQAEKRIDALQRDQYRMQLELLARKAALAEGVEAAAIASAPLDDVVTSAKQAWDALPRIPGKAESALAKRLAMASVATVAGIAAGREARETMLLDLEIALGLPSPEASAPARRRRQLERLQNRFGSGTPHSPEAQDVLIEWYATAASADDALDQRMAEVVRKLVEKDAAARR